MSTASDELPETLPEAAPEVSPLRHPHLPESDPRNIVDPDSEIPPVLQIDSYRRAHPHAPR